VTGANRSAPADRETAPVIEMRGIGKVYKSGRLEVDALRDVDLEVHDGDFLAIVGPSGSGKSTLMNVLGCLDRPSSGTYRLTGANVAELDDDALARLRNRTIGFVFQSFNLLARTSALENVAMPLLYAGVSRADRNARAREALERLGLGDRMDHQPSELSGGQQQRVAIARALVTKPAILLADEPTGNLDSKSGADVLALLHELNSAGTTVVLITHDTDVAVQAKRSVHVKDGRLAA
jgi:putative ABC transport system ATP-binding protein